MAKIPEILKALKKSKPDVGTTYLIYTLSTDNLKNFKVNNSDVMKPFSQWKSHMEFHADDIAIATKKCAVGTSERSTGRKRKQDQRSEKKADKSEAAVEPYYKGKAKK